ncbi:uncharacterized protein K489DRAFT_19235 [Dissoconium aciculare CBS 342.82]|uniref:Uncharacterized protein n=1 Tax=Dissoconium aciculare CBS 342.82 TaxID=1314786 RepID=A0A6J3MIJ6_9PEZI|nr:uncharacterized protein K489DRAFT_19235 [Dissoconium aciculare CBS 342.82]KAF1827524.1 hypothetical protein K489DRAFT_19235 [Dissoconium aciculare CBS 342.82]
MYPPVRRSCSDSPTPSLLYVVPIASGVRSRSPSQRYFGHYARASSELRSSRYAAALMIAIGVALRDAWRKSCPEIKKASSS